MSDQTKETSAIRGVVAALTLWGDSDLVEAADVLNGIGREALPAAMGIIEVCIETITTLSGMSRTEVLRTLALQIADGCIRWENGERP